jgi:hypothetical protein
LHGEDSTEADKTLEGRGEPGRLSGSSLQRADLEATERVLVAICDLLVRTASEDEESLEREDTPEISPKNTDPDMDFLVLSHLTLPPKGLIRPPLHKRFLGSKSQTPAFWNAGLEKEKDSTFGKGIGTWEESSTSTTEKRKIQL